MTEGHDKRLTDKGLFKWLPLWPVFTGVIMAAVAVGGYIATLKYMATDNKAIHEDLTTIHQWINLHETWAKDKNGILERVVAIQEGQDKRIKRMEEHEDGSWFSLQRRRQKSELPVMYDSLEGDDG